MAVASSSGNSTPSLIQKLPSIYDVRWSPAGNLIACSTSDKLFLISPDGQTKSIVNAQWTTFDWDKDGLSLVGIVRHADGSRWLTSLEVSSGNVHEVGALDLPSVAEIAWISLSRRSHTIALAVSKPRGDIWMLEGFAPESIFERLFHTNQ